VTSELFRFSVTQFLFALILVLVANPFLSQFHRGEVIVSASMTLVLISAVLAVGGSGRLLVFTILLVLLAVGAELVKSCTLHGHSLHFAYRSG
jgi:hypothetical protein